MLREGLEAELPEVFAFFRRLHLTVAEMPLWMVAVGAIGVRSLTFTALAGAHAVLQAFGVLQFRSFEATAVVSYAAALLFAFASARQRGVVAALAAFAALGSVSYLAQLPGRRLFCERAGPEAAASVCDVVGLNVQALVLVAFGALVAYAVRRLARRGPRGISALAFAFGAGALLTALAGLAIGMLVSLEDGTATLSWHVAGGLLSAAVTGAVAGWWGRRHVFDAAAILGTALLGGVPLVRSLITATVDAAIPTSVDWRYFALLLYGPVAIAALAVTAWIRTRRITLAVSAAGALLTCRRRCHGLRTAGARDRPDGRARARAAAVRAQGGERHDSRRHARGQWICGQDGAPRREPSCAYR